MIWMEFFEPLWQNRSELLHQQKNNYKRAEDAALTEQLEWYQSNRHTLLAHHDHFLLHNIDTATLHTMPSMQKREWIRHLTVAKVANTQELTLMKTNQDSFFRCMIPVNAPSTATLGALLPREKPTNPTQQGGKTPNWREHNLNKTTHIPQTTDNQRPQENGTTSAKRSDRKTTPRTPCGYRWRVLPRRILLHLPQKRGTTNQVLGHPPKHRVHNLPHTRKRVPCWSDLQSDKTPARRQWQIQGTPWQPVHSLYANHIQGHTGQTNKTTTAV
jgi:hypothetical protein